MVDKIVLGVCGSVAAVRTIELVRELKRQGYFVEVVMSEAATNLVGADGLHWAADNPVITRLDGSVPYIKSCGIGGDAKLLLICPATSNTISKIAAGIDDTPITTYAATALGSGCPIAIVPAMHYAMYENPFVQEAITKMKDAGISFLDPKVEENKAKLPDKGDIIAFVKNTLGV